MKWLFRNDLGKIRHSPVEFVIARIAFALVMVVAMDSLIRKNTQSTLREPHGIAAIGASAEGELGWAGEFVLWFSATEGIPAAWMVIFAVLLAFYIIGFMPIPTVAGLFAIHTLAGTFYMSQGAMHHGQQIIGLTLFGQLLASVWSAFRRRGRDSLLWQDSAHHRDCSMFLCQQMIAAGYVITGLTKFEKSKGDWIEDSPNLVVQFEKNRQMDFYNKLQPSDDAATQWMSDFLINYPILGMILFGGVIFLEFGAFFALFNRVILALWGLALLAMHLSISVIMKLDFFYNELILLIFFVNLPFWIGVVWRRFFRTV